MNPETLDPPGTPHFPIEAWADYVRGVADAELQPQMATHLKGCDACTRLVTLLIDIGAVIRGGGDDSSGH